MRSFYEPSNHYWIVGEDQEQLWSSASGGYVPADDPAYLAWLATERLPTRIATEEELDAVLLAAGRGAQAPHPPKRTVAKSVIVSRLIAAGKIDAAKAALEASPAAFARWFAADRPAINFDDPDAIALLTAIGADPGAILAA